MPASNELVTSLFFKSSTMAPLELYADIDELHTPDIGTMLAISDAQHENAYEELREPLASVEFKLERKAEPQRKQKRNAQA